jgi:hypothetical protein
VLPKRYPLLLHNTLLLLVLSCVTILQQQSKTLAFVSLLVQLNNKSILSPASAGPISQDETTSVIHIIPFLKISKLFLAALQVTESQQASAKPTNRRGTTLHYHTTTTTTTTDGKTTAQRQQQQGNDTGSSADSDVPTVLHLTYRAPVHYRIQIKVHGTVCTDDSRMDRPQYRPAGSTAPACYPLKSLIPTSGALDCF